MSRLTVWNPWRMMPAPWVDDEELFEVMDDIQMDVYESGDEVTVKVKVSGYDKDKLKISVEGSQFTISGTAEEVNEEEEKKKKYYRKEIRTRSFTRTTDLPSLVDADRAKAVFKNGVLTVTLPKREEAKPKNIEVKLEE